MISTVLYNIQWRCYQFCQCWPTSDDTNHGRDQFHVSSWKTYS